MKTLDLVCYTKSVEFAEALIDQGHLAIDPTKGEWMTYHLKFTKAYQALKNWIGHFPLWTIKDGIMPTWVDYYGNDSIPSATGIVDHENMIQIKLKVPADKVLESTFYRWTDFVCGSWSDVRDVFNDEPYNYDREFHIDMIQYLVKELDPKWIVDIVFPQAKGI